MEEKILYDLSTFFYKKRSVTASSLFYAENVV